MTGCIAETYTRSSLCSLFIYCSECAGVLQESGQLPLPALQEKTIKRSSYNINLNPLPFFDQFCLERDQSLPDEEGGISVIV